MLLSLFSFGLFMGILLSPIETLIHEYGHCLAIILVKPKIKTFKQKLYIKPKLTKSFFIFQEGKTHSNLLKYISDKPSEHKTEIRIIALSGMLFSNILYISALFASLHYKLYILVGVFSFSIFRELLSFFTAKHEQSDKHLKKYPEMFHYTEP